MTPPPAAGLRKRWARSLGQAGIDLRALFRACCGIPRYVRDRRRYLAEVPDAVDPMPEFLDSPCLSDWGHAGGTANGHYFHQDLLVARRIFAAAPAHHADVGSRLDGFVAHLAVFRPVEVFDIRPLISRVPQVRFRQADLMGTLPTELIGCTPSLSCLHALEHFGLGRYGDPIAPDGHLRGLDNLVAMLEPGGVLYLSVPIGPSRVEFNAHRVFALPHLVRLVERHLRVRRFSFVDDAGDLQDDVAWTGDAAAQSYGCTYGCGIIEAVKC